MNAFDAMTMRGVAIVGRTGSGKSTLFHGSEYVLDVCITDTGSLGHIPHHRGGGEIHTLIPTDMAKSPIQFVTEWVNRMEVEKRVWCLDSWSALEWMQCAWYKRKTGKPIMDKPGHNTVVNQMRDLALTLAMSRGFVTFNTGNGGTIILDNGELMTQPKGCLTGYPSLNGTSPGKETVLARWSTVWIIVPGMPDKSPEEPSKVPRGFMLDSDDFRGGEYGFYVPLKDGYRVMSAGLIPASDKHGPVNLRVDPVSRDQGAPIDAIIRRMMANCPPVDKPKRGRKSAVAEPSENGHVEPEKAPANVE